jgi:LPS export ABC transporter protein LptC
MVLEKIRTLVLLAGISLIGYGCYVFLFSFQATSESIDIHFNDDGLDVKIKNFKVIHEDSASKKWELKAKLATVSQKNKNTLMNNVEYVFINDEKKKFKIYADFGTLVNKTNDLRLEGNVKMLIQTDALTNQIVNNSVVKNKSALTSR